MNASYDTPPPQHTAEAPSRPALSRRRMLRTSGVTLLAGGFAIATLGSARASAALPFKALISAAIAQWTDATYQLTGSATASHLGRAGYQGVAVVTSTTSGGAFAATLTETLIAANGDTLTLLCQQIANPVSTSTPLLYETTDQWTVIGGTGRFAGATGSGTGETAIDFGTGQVTKSCRGSITLGG